MKVVRRAPNIMEMSEKGLGQLAVFCGLGGEAYLLMK